MRPSKLSKCLVLLIASMLALTACGGASSSGSTASSAGISVDTAQKAEILLDTTTMLIGTDAGFRLSVGSVIISYVEPITLESSDESVATVAADKETGKFLITGQSVGTATITATYEEATASATIRVVDPYASGSPSELAGPSSVEVPSFGNATATFAIGNVGSEIKSVNAQFYSSKEISVSLSSGEWNGAQLAINLFSMDAAGDSGLGYLVITDAARPDYVVAAAVFDITTK